ncbi:MAG: GIY-YIG nuclease family protein [bacterium]
MVIRADIKNKILEQAKKLPLSPGIYRFLDKDKEILYIGRATLLRRRVLSYFQKQQEPRIKEMIAMAKSITYRKTDSVLEAIILEANEIKSNWPKYNVKDRDNRSFIYIVFKDIDYPRPYLIRAHELEPLKAVINKNNIFGPYQSQTLINNALKILRRIFPYSTCRPNIDKACFDYQIGLCPGACVGKISIEDYQENIHNLKLFLSGHKVALLKKLKKQNPLQFAGLKHIQDVALISQEEGNGIYADKVNRIEGYDISHLAGQETFGGMVTFINGLPDKSYYRLFKIKEAPKNDDLRALEEMIIRRFGHPEWPFPDLIMIDGGLPQIRFIKKTLKDIRINILVVGISKYGNDKLVYPTSTKQSRKIIIESIKPLLLRVRDEVHRFAIKNSRRRRQAD